MQTIIINGENTRNCLSSRYVYVERLFNWRGRPYYGRMKDFWKCYIATVRGGSIRDAEGAIDWVTYVTKPNSMDGA